MCFFGLRCWFRPNLTQRVVGMWMRQALVQVALFIAFTIQCRPTTEKTLDLEKHGQCRKRSMVSAQTEKRQDKANDDNQTDDVNDDVHGCSFDAFWAEAGSIK